MSNVVTYETARALKEAGFPQPATVELDQCWYSCNRERFTITNDFKTGIPPEKWFACYPYFAPTATDILEQMPWECLLGNIGKRFAVYRRDVKTVFAVPEAVEDNPAEAVAAAWLSSRQTVKIPDDLKDKIEGNKLILQKHP